MRPIRSAGRFAKRGRLRILVMASAAWMATACTTHPGGQRMSNDTAGLAQCAIKGVEGEALCGTIEVRENRPSGRGQLIPLKVVVLRALGPERQPDPLFTFAGGPGQGETADAADNGERFAAIRRERDIVMIDQRGTGGSNPLPCDLGTPSELVQAFLAGDLPLHRVRECRESLQARADLRFYTTPFAVDDVEEVRRRLGYERINLYGGSYGSRAAFVYLQQHPERVRTATLRAVFPVTLRNPLHSPRDAQASLDRLFSDCAADKACGERYRDLPQRFDEVLQRLSAQPVALDIPAGGTTARISITRDVFAGLIRRMLYHPRSQALVPSAIAAASRGDFTPFAPILAQSLGIGRVLSFGLFLSVTCAEDVAAISPADIPVATNGTFSGPVIVNSLVAACAEWPQGQLPRDYWKPERRKAPVLMVSGALDPVTPPRYGEQLKAVLPNARHLVLEGVAHGPFPDCAIGIMTQFIRTGSAESLDTDCLANLRRPPFS